MLKIAFLTSSNYQSVIQKCPSFIDEYQFLFPFFKEKNADLIQVDWRNPSIAWQQFDVILPKACWDYPTHAEEFETFLKKIIALKVPVTNHATTVLWNMRKTYLKDLQNRGLHVADLLIFAQHSKINLTDLMHAVDTKWKTATTLVAKPSIGSGASDTLRFAKEDIANQMALFNKILTYADLILQPYFPEIACAGEYSYFFFNNSFSHAILKQPSSGEYRAHKLFGATNTAYQPTPSEISAAFEFVGSVKPLCEYARVDVFKKENTLYLIELELIEPYLYFELADTEAPRRFCNAVLHQY